MGPGAGSGLVGPTILTREAPSHGDLGATYLVVPSVEGSPIRPAHGVSGQADIVRPLPQPARVPQQALQKFHFLQPDSFFLAEGGRPLEMAEDGSVCTVA
eukprot:2496243-Pyramimonas_sp.AAC.1